MLNSRLFKKIIFTVLALLVLLAAITVAAVAGSDASPAPVIVSKNVCYSNKLHLMYAVPRSSVGDNSEIVIELFKAEPDKLSVPYATVTPSSEEKIPCISKNETCLIFYSTGIAAKEIANEIWARPVSIDGNGNRTEGEAVCYSILEYCYQRLCDDGFILVEDEGDDLRRRELYLTMIEYGFNAYKVLGKPTDKNPSAVKYIAVNGSTSDVAGIANEEYGSFTVNNDALPEHHIFSHWSVDRISPDGSVTREKLTSTSISPTASVGAAAYSVMSVVDPAYARAEEIAAQDKIDEANRLAEWEALEKAFVSSKGYDPENAANIVSEMKTLYTLYGKEMVYWVASLYAKGFNDLENGIWAGGFYASTAGRDMTGYGPDLQSTVQLLRFLNTSGVISSESKDIPKWMQQEMIYFAKSLQDENGYFYHPQWGKEFTDTKISRRGRDLGWGVSLLSSFGEKPVYDTPSGVIGDGQSADQYLQDIGIDKNHQPLTAITASISSSTAVAVSKVVAVSSTDSSTSYLKTLTSFVNYLITEIEPGMLNSPYGTGNTLNATSAQIRYYANINGIYHYTPGDESHTPGATAEDYMRFDGMDMEEMTLEVLLDTVNPKTGLYGGYNADGSFSGQESLNFSNTNGFFKVITLFNSRNMPYPQAALAASSIIANLTNPDLPSTGNACDVYNLWSEIGSLKSNPAASFKVYARISGGNLKLCDEFDDDAMAMTVTEFINKSLELRGADAVRITFDKIKGYKKSDGAFSHSYTSGATSHQGCPIAPSGNNVSDVDGTCIASTGLVRSMFTAFGMGSYRPNFFGKADYMRFIDYIEAADPILKPNSEFLVEDFEDQSYKNSFSGDFEISDGNMTVTGETQISLSSLSTLGKTVTFSASLSLDDGNHYITVSTNTIALIRLELAVISNAVTIKNLDTGSYYFIPYNETDIDLLVSLEHKGDYALLSIGFNGTGAFTENLFLESLPEKLTAINTLLLSTDSKIKLDDLVFAICPPTLKSALSGDRLTFESLQIDKIESFSQFGGLLSFTNQVTDGTSYASIVYEGNNKFLRLNDGWGTGSSSQNFFDFGVNGDVDETVVFESDFRINYVSGSNLIPVSIAGNSTAYYCSFKITGGYVYAGVAESKAARSENLVKTSVKNNEWFTMRIEYTAGSSYDEGFICKLFINGVLVDSETKKCEGLTYSSAANIKYFRMACDTNWTGTLDYDNVYVGDLENYSPYQPPENEEHIHVSYFTIQNQTDSTCNVHGGYEKIFYCYDVSCGATLGKVFVTLPFSHSLGEEQEENYKAPSCTESGTVDYVVYCSNCQKELSRVTKTLTPGHSVETREYVISEATCSVEGSYVLISYCSMCDKSFSEIEHTIPTVPHRVETNVCLDCGETDIEIFGVIDFSKIEAKDYLSENSSGNVTLSPYASNGTHINLYTPAADLASAAVVSEGTNKYLSFIKTTNTNSSNVWTNVRRDSSTEIDQLIFESRIRVTVDELKDGGIYIRMYTGRTSASNGTRLFSDTFTKNGSYLKYSGVTTHLHLGEWGTVRLILTESNGVFTRTFYVKNEGESSISYSGKSYSPGEFIPYFSSTSFENSSSLTSVSAVNVITLMHSTGLIGGYDLDDVYFGGSYTYVTKK